jgi:hypothetical protein
MPASYFDVDGTLVRTNLVHPTLFYLLNQATPGRTLARLAGALLRAPRLALAELRDRRAFNEELYQLFRGMSEDRLHALADEAVREGAAPGDLPQRPRARPPLQGPRPRGGHLLRRARLPHGPASPASSGPTRSSPTGWSSTTASRAAG